MSSDCVQENVEEKTRKEIEYRRGATLLRWHVQFARQKRQEEEARQACNVVLRQHGFPLVKKKAASLGRLVDITGDMTGDEVHRLVWYRMNGYQSKDLALLFERC